MLEELKLEMARSRVVSVKEGETGSGMVETFLR
jgi:hypothetical protein